MSRRGERLREDFKYLRETGLIFIIVLILAVITLVLFFRYLFWLQQVQIVATVYRKEKVKGSRGAETWTAYFEYVDGDGIKHLASGSNGKDEPGESIEIYYDKKNPQKCRTANGVSALKLLSIIMAICTVAYFLIGIGVLG